MGGSVYSYSWDDPQFQTDSIATGLCAGTYNVTITDANNCVVTGSATLTEPAAMVLTPTSVNANCGQADGSVSVAVSGGLGTYTYLWDDPSPSTADT